MRHTKIIATVGPASESAAVLEGLLVAGVGVFRLNFSHGTRESHGAAYAAIREACRKTGIYSRWRRSARASLSQAPIRMS